MQQQWPITAKDVCKIITSPEIQALLKDCGVMKTSISEWAACEWLEKLSWRYRVQRKGMYIHISQSFFSAPSAELKVTNSRKLQMGPSQQKSTNIPL